MRDTVRETVAIENLTAADFSGHLESRFEALLADGNILSLALVSIAESRFAVPGHRKGFSLIFTGPREPVLPQQIYSLTHPLMGRLDIFIVPIGVTADSCRYEAVFN